MKKFIASNDNQFTPEGTVLFLGFGYTAKHIAEILHKNKWQYLYLPTRNNPAKNEFIGRGFHHLGLSASGNLEQAIAETTALDKDTIPPKSAASLYTQHFQSDAEIISFQHNPPLIESEKSQAPLKETPFMAEIIELASKRKNTKPYSFNEYISRMLKNVTHILVTAPPSNHDDPALNKYIELIIRLTPQIKWLGYLSATSVYGDSQGQIVTEQAPCTPASQRGQDRLRIEKLWQAMHAKFKTPVHIFRLSGIYGFGRSNVEKVQQENIVNIIKENHIQNRIYIKDIAKILFASMNNPTPAEIFNLSDDYPCATAEVNNYIAELLKCPLPACVSYAEYVSKMSEMQKSFYQETKNISNQKIKDILGISLDFPTYKEGIQDILASFKNS